MNSEKDLSTLIERVQAYQNTEHEKNRRRIRNGFRSMLIVPLVFLVLMFLSDLTGTSKLIMLVVWIVSMILIATYLIVVEYVDYKLMNMMMPGSDRAEARSAESCVASYTASCAEPCEVSNNGPEQDAQVDKQEETV